jgi:murein DD-endopeptidase MepM/ murein hydrolase activator NlpD
MESIIARQRIARRRPLPIAEAPHPAAAAHSLLFKPRAARAKRGPEADFLFLEGAVDRVAHTPQSHILRKERSSTRRSSPAFPFTRFFKASRTALSGAFVALPHPTKRTRGIAIGAGLGSAILITAAILLFRGPAFPLPEGALLPEDGAAADLLLSYAVPEGIATDDEGDGLSDAPPPPAVLEIQTYTVRPGDSVVSIAKRFRLSADSIISINGISSARAIKAGTTLKIPNMDGLVYRVRAGDSLGAIARRYRTEMTRLADANDLGSSVLVPGQSIFIPGARLSTSELKRVFGEFVAWPIRGTISSYFGYRPNPFTGIRQFHAGLDIVAAPGYPIHAAMDGKVADVGYNSVFGNYVIVSHADGFQTLYGHMTSYSVVRGQKVAQGSVIGKVGNTGYSTGPHLHFGLFKRGAAVNPLKYLK